MANEIVNDDGCMCPTCTRARELTMKCLTLTVDNNGTAIEWYMAMISAGATIIANKLGPLDQLAAASSMRDVSERITNHARQTLAGAGCVGVPVTEVRDEKATKSTTN